VGVSDEYGDVEAGVDSRAKHTPTAGYKSKAGLVGDVSQAQSCLGPIRLVQERGFH
jgi:hypothetical protein